MNRDVYFLPKRGNRFSLSPGERAGVRVSVKHILIRAFTSVEALIPPSSACFKN